MNGDPRSLVGFARGDDRKTRVMLRNGQLVYEHVGIVVDTIPERKHEPDADPEEDTLP